MTDLYPYQRAGVAWLAQQKTALLADEMGLGKTAQAILAAAEVRAKSIGVVCPASLRLNWRREFARWWPDWIEMPTLYVESYDKVARGIWKKPQFDVLVIDEAHYAKTASARRTTMLYGKDADGTGLVAHAKHVWLLTGTPAPNNPAELWTHLRALRPALVTGKNGKPASYWSFAKRYCHVVDQGFGPKIMRGKNLPELKALIAPFVLRRTKVEVLNDLPEIRFDVLPLDGDILKAARGLNETIDGINLLDQGHRLKTVLADHGVDGLRAIASHVATVRRITAMAKVPALIDWIENFLESGEKLVVFAHHRDVLDALDKAFRVEAGFVGTPRQYWNVSMARIDGATTNRQGEVDLFQSNPKCRLFIGQLQAAGTGLTLTAASTVLLAEQSWVPAENVQAAARVHRIGQKNACQVWSAVLAGSIDEQVGDALTRKMNDLVQLFGSV